MRFFILGLFCMKFSVYAHEGGETTAKVGPGQAVEFFDANKGLKLSQKAVKNLGIKTTANQNAGRADVPRTAVIHFKEEAAVFILRNEFFKFIPIKTVKTTSEQLNVISPEIKSGDQIVIEGAPLLRVAYLNLATSDSEESGEHGSGDEHHEEDHDDGEHDD